MTKKEKVFEYVVLNDYTSIQKLSFIDQLRVLLKKLTHNDAQEIKREDIVTKDYLTAKANLVKFFSKALEPIQRGEKESVMLSVHSDFDRTSPYSDGRKTILEEVLESSKFDNYYEYKILRPDLEYDIEHYITVTFKIK